MTDDELRAAIREVREGVQNRRNASFSLPDLMPLVHARDAAEAKVASIGTVNPRPPGVVSSVIQSVKRLAARALNWHVREQVEFNKASMAATQATLEALNEANRVLGNLVSHIRSDQEIHTLRAIAELQALFRARVAEVEEAFARANLQHEKLIHQELRLVRQRSELPVTAAAPPAGESAPLPAIDWLKFAERFRGPEDRLREHQKRYLARFKNAENVLDLGCGRGEFLEVARDAGLSAMGVDSNAEFVSLCKTKGLNAKTDDMLAYLAALPDTSLGGVFCSHVIEHLPPADLPRLVQLIGQKTKPDATVVFETPNAESSAILTTHFYLDPTHVRPVPATLLRFYLEEAGFGAIETEQIPPEALDCAIYARKL